MPLTELNALHSTYERINLGVHRRAASRVGVPSLVRHLGLWDVSGARDIDDPLRSSADRGKAFNDYLADLRATIEGGANDTIHCEASELPASSGEAARSGTIRLIRFWWYGMRATIRAELRTEYVMLTCIIDLSIRLDYRYRAPADPDDPQRKVEAVLQDVSKIFGLAAKDEGRCRATARFLQYEIWDRFEKTVLDAELGGTTILGAKLGQVFADFRGIVTGSRCEEVSKKGAVERRHLLCERFARQPNEDRMREGMCHDEPPEEWAPEVLKKLWPIIECERYLHEHEFTVSGFLDGRALFITALGPKPPQAMSPKSAWTPVCNFFHCYTDDEWQLGRLIDRIMNLGTLRLAALVEIDRLVEAGQKVDELAVAIRQADNAIQGELRLKSNPRPEEPKRRGEATGETESQAAATGANEAMEEVRSRFTEVDGTVSTGIMYRLERSEYYIEQFMKGLAELRVKRVEGFQQYGEMVSRRMSNLFSYVQLLKKRMLDVDSRMSLLNQAFSALRAVKADEKIKKIQEFGEIALIAFLLPYYIGATLFYYMFHLPDEIAKYNWLGLVSLGASFIIVRQIWAMCRRGVRTGSLIIVAFMIIYIVTLAVFVLRTP